MKKVSIAITLFLVFVAFLPVVAQKQAQVNIGVQPLWGPVGYDYVDYYYMPDIDVYYSVPRRQYVYQDGGRWLFAPALPARYRSYDLNRGYKVVINDDRMPYQRAEVYKVKYAPYKGRYDQVIIRNSNDSKYYVVKGHPGHGKWKEGKVKNGKGKKH